MKAIEDMWYRPASEGFAGLARLLLPLSLLFRSIVERRRRRFLQRRQRGELWRPPVPVIVVGNITVGGTGKTPVVVALVEYFAARGLSPGVVSRGYGGQPDALPLSVGGDTEARSCGDEPLLVHLRTGCPVVVDPDRPRALRRLLAEHAVDLVISDDGLQHYRLHRDFELAVVDARRGLGNGLCLPAGPLREPASRLDSVDAVLLNGCGSLRAAPAAYAFELHSRKLVNVCSGAGAALSEVSPDGVVHAVAGIGNPVRFFDSLRALGLTPIEHAFADHYAFRGDDIDFGDALPVIMTEKDAVKCRRFAASHHWYLPVDAVLPAALLQQIERSVSHCRAGAAAQQPGA